MRTFPGCARKEISIHVPLAGNVLSKNLRMVQLAKFLSTFPLRGTSAAYHNRDDDLCHFYPRSPCGERQAASLISAPMKIFLSTFPLRGTSRLHRLLHVLSDISIHVPLAGNVLHSFATAYWTSYFYPRSPCGERQANYSFGLFKSRISIHVPLAGNVRASTHSSSLPKRFLSTFPLRGTSRSALPYRLCY